MPDTKISALAAAGVLTGSESLPIVQGSATVKTTLDSLVPLVEAELPAFFGTMRSLSPSDDVPLNAYASDLDSYVADIDEAQDLLDAAQAVGAVAAAITKLNGVAITTYTTLASVISAALPDGSLWRIAWTGDTYEADGEVIGTIVAGDPSWRGVIPWPKIGTTVSTLASGSGGTRTSDGAGRPVLNTTSTSGSFVEVDLGLQLRTPTLAQLNMHMTIAAPSSSGDSVLAFQLMRVSNNTLRLWNYLIYNSVWESGFFQTSGTAGDDPIGNSSTAGQFASGRKVELTITLPSERRIAQPSYYTTGRTPAGGSVSNLFSTVLASNGDFTASQKWGLVARGRSTGTAQTIVVTGVSLA